MININYNGESISISSKMNVVDLLNSDQIKMLNINSVAVVLNEHILPRTQWESVILQPNDSVQVFKAVAGG